MTIARTPYDALPGALLAELEAAGERVLRTTKEQALADPRQLVARLTAAGAPRPTLGREP